jgi:hypothetical protein
MIHSLNLWPQSRSVWGNYDAAVIPALAGLDHNQCYKPKLYTAPSLAVQLMPPTGDGAYLRYQMQITPGSLICGFQQSTQTPYFTCQFTDISTGLKFWDTPVSNVFVSNPAGDYPNLFNCPRQVVGSGMFRCEFWANPQNTETMRVYAVLIVADVVQCQE